ncbi:uncharacterized protein LOC121319221 isoform X2 [Polyodon spathula]|uniref:uncharacterized protein LOC121319221 isoform X2 n=1 Tax=Polyodon spathula TaxID=7913 RepID=UPI001B7E7ABE|nr:uncharacterized protein LOC121319221 isoform X2 [Polyodon spathula]
MHHYYPAEARRSRPCKKRKRDRFNCNLKLPAASVCYIAEMENSVDYSSKTRAEASNAGTQLQRMEEGGIEIGPTDTAEDKNKDQSVGEGCDEEYCVYLTRDASEEVTGLRESVDEMLTRLDEFCGMLDMIRKDSSEILDQHIPYITMKTAEMKNVYAKIDKIEKRESATRKSYELPVLFRTEEFFTAEPGSAEMKKPNS